MRHGCELWCRSQMRLGFAWLWLRCRPAAVAPIGPLAWEPPDATGVAAKTQIKKTNPVRKTRGIKRAGDQLAHSHDTGTSPRTRAAEVRLESTSHNWPLTDARTASRMAGLGASATGCKPCP